jgi:integrase
MANVNRYIKARRGRERSGERLYLQVPVPKDLRAVFGRACLERCLHTDSLTVARMRRDAALPEILAMFDRVRQEPTLDQALAVIRRDELARAHAVWSERVVERGIAGARSALADLLEDEHVQIDDQDWTPAPSAAWQQRARRMLLLHGLAPTDQATEAAATALLEAHIDGAELVLEGRALPARNGLHAAARRVQPDMYTAIAFTAAAERYVEERQAVWTQHTLAQYESTLRQFGEHVGAGRALAAITRADVANFIAKLAAKPSPRAGGLPSARTLNRHANTIATLFKWATAAGLFAGENPATGHRRPEGGNRKRHPFGPAELRTLLEASRPEVRPQHHSVQTALPWLIWLGAYTGARLNELCGLRVEDVRQADGISYLDLVDHLGRRLKTTAAERKVPLHSKLLAIGFAEYIAHVRAGDHGYLFPGLPPGGPDDKRSWHATKAFTRLRRKLGLDRPGVVFHSLRNTVATALHEAGVPEVEAAALLGHEVPTMTYGLYSGGLSLARLRDAVERIRH